MQHVDHLSRLAVGVNRVVIGPRILAPGCGLYPSLRKRGGARGGVTGGHRKSMEGDVHADQVKLGANLAYGRKGKGGLDGK